jgi:hypothetical protein
MADIENPRRHPRITIRCDARVALSGAKYFCAPTQDVGPGGMGLAMEEPIERGEKAFVEVRNEGLPRPHFLSGRIAWCSEAPPWRGGIAFDPSSARAAETLFEQLVWAYPEAAGQERFLERIPEDAVLTPTPVPGALPTFSLEPIPHEAEMLEAIGSGVDVRTLRERMGERWTSCVRGLFALVGRGAIEIAGAADR